MQVSARIEPEQVLGFLGDDAVDRLQEYFSSSRFTGGRFERFGGGGDREEIANRFTAEDLVAVSMLSIRIPGTAAIEIVETQAKLLSELLSEVPNGLDLWDATESTIDDASHANALWTELKAIRGVGWVTAGKLVARKRPRLCTTVSSKQLCSAGRRTAGGDRFEHCWSTSRR